MQDLQENTVIIFLVGNNDITSSHHPAVDYFTVTPLSVYYLAKEVMFLALSTTMPNIPNQFP